MRILVISDLHIGASARCISLVPKDERNNTNGHNDNYLEYMEKFSKSLDTHIDAIIISGDISDRARIEQYEHFNEIISKIMDMFSLKTNAIYFTGGNHDVDWSALEGKSLREASEARKKLRFEPIFYSDILKTRHSDAYENLFSDPYYCVWNDDDLYVMSVNTAAHDDCKSENHPGFISQETLNAIDNQCLSDGIIDLEKPKILLMHHHPVNYPNQSPEWKDFSILQCHRDIIEFASSYGFDLLLHGHRHHPYFQTVLASNGRQISIMCSGSFSHAFPLYIYDNLSNLIHIIDTHGRSAGTNILQGEIHSYAFSSGNGWRPCIRPSDGINKIVTFGPNEHRTKLCTIAEKYILEKISLSRVCVLSEMKTSVTELRYKDDALLFEISMEICEKNGLSPYGNSFDSCVILKNGETS